MESVPRFLDIYLAKFLAKRSGLAAEERVRFTNLIEKLSVGMDEGHSCLELHEEERAMVAASSLVSDSAQTPLVLSGNRLYLQRLFQYESRLAHQLLQLAGNTANGSVEPSLLDAIFGVETGEVDYQRMAAELAMRKALCIISGGPGTGKTTTVVKILALLVSACGKDEMTIALAAPTGKAAMRLQESIAKSIEHLEVAEDVREKLPRSAVTLHRLLGVRKHSPQFLHHRDNPLQWDVIVVDEASMVDLALMSKLVDGLKPDSRLILLGDKDQLSSVESGAVLADCIRSLPGNTVELKKSYRFEGGIKKLAEAINSGDGELCWSILTGGEIGNVTVLRNSYFEAIGYHYSGYMAMVREMERQSSMELARIFQRFKQFRVLCATRQGSCGVQRINEKTENFLFRQGMFTKTTWYSGRPVMVTANDYSLDLYNGDIGICFPDHKSGVMKIWFEKSDGGYRSCLPSRLPRCETAFAMTIHKSQGSEFSRVMVVLPDQESRVLSRQLIYTAVTRAKDSVDIVASKNIFVYAVKSDYTRSSGLAHLLRESGSSDE